MTPEEKNKIFEELVKEEAKKDDEFLKMMKEEFNLPIDRNANFNQIVKNILYVFAKELIKLKKEAK